MNKEMIFALTQSVLALLVVAGGGVLLYLDGVSGEVYTGLVGAILGYYFGSALGPIQLVRNGTWSRKD